MSHIQQKNQQAGFWFLVDGSELYLPDPSLASQGLPFGDGSGWGVDAKQAINIGDYEGKPCYWLNISEMDVTFEMSSLRQLLHAPKDLFMLATRACQLGHMMSSIRFCPQCGGRTHLNRTELAMQCKECRILHYPRIFPCIIVAIRRDDTILLANHARHSNNGLFTVLAGFVEVGETLEQCVAREIKEESGIDVTNIRYFGSQPWGFPSSLMVGFLADYAGGEIKVDKHELAAADWFKPSQLPLIPDHGTIARALIEQTIKLIGRSGISPIN